MPASQLKYVSCLQVDILTMVAPELPCPVAHTVSRQIEGVRPKSGHVCNV